MLINLKTFAKQNGENYESLLKFASDHPEHFPVTEGVQGPEISEFFTDELLKVYRSEYDDHIEKLNPFIFPDTFTEWDKND